MPDAILVINTGSSSLKFGLYEEDYGDEQLLFDGLADGIGRPEGTIQLKDEAGRVVRSEALPSATAAGALEHAAGWLTEMGGAPPVAVGHRVVHGGPQLTEHQRITPGLLDELRGALHFAPLHLPAALALIEATERAYPAQPQFACFDTAFHTTMPPVAKQLPLPRALFEEGVQRYGFHGLSYESIVHFLGKELPARTVVAHLGSGASLAALDHGRSVDTSMGLTPTGGIPMGTRTGDLDPGVLLYLLREKAMTPEALEGMLNHDAGLKALSGGESDMRALETAAGAGEAGATLATEAFTIAIAKYVAGYATVLGGLDLLVFAGGIGEHSAAVRQHVCDRLGAIGLVLDDAANQRHGADGIDAPPSRVRVRIVPSQEDRQIARHCRRLLRSVR